MDRMQSCTRMRVSCTSCMALLIRASWADENGVVQDEIARTLGKSLRLMMVHVITSKEPWVGLADD